jgi:hypothetical protein
MKLWYKTEEGKWRRFPHEKVKLDTKGHRYLTGHTWIDLTQEINVKTFNTLFDYANGHYVLREDT